MAKSKSKKSVKKIPKKILYKINQAKQDKGIYKKMSKILEKEEQYKEYVDKLTKRNLERAGIKEPVKPVEPIKPVKPSKYEWKDEPIDNEKDEEYIDWNYDYKPPTEPWQDEDLVFQPAMVERLRAAVQRGRPAGRGGRLTGGRTTGGAMVSIPINDEIYVYQPDKVKRDLESSIKKGVYEEINKPATTGMLKNSYNGINWNGDMLGEGVKYKNSNVSSVITNQKIQDADLENEQDYMKRRAEKRYKIENDLTKLQEKDENINEVLRNMAYLSPEASGNIERRAAAPKYKQVVFDYRGDNYVKLITRPYVKEQQKEINDINNYHNDRMNEEYIQDKRYLPIYENKKDKYLQENQDREDHYLRYAHDDENKIFNILTSNSMKSSIYTGLRNDVPTHNEAVRNSMKASYASMTDASRKLAHNPNYFTHNTNGLHGIITPYQSFSPTKQDLVLRSQAQALSRPIYT